MMTAEGGMKPLRVRAQKSLPLKPLIFHFYRNILLCQGG
jgi:hypothetical protein